MNGLIYEGLVAIDPNIIFRSSFLKDDVIAPLEEGEILAHTSGPSCDVPGDDAQ